jgi:hypothetical protein
VEEQNVIEGHRLLEQRATVRLQRYWLSLRQRDGVAWFSDFRPSRCPAPWDQCVLVSLGARPGDFTIEHLGTALAAGPPGHPGFGAMLLRSLPEVVARRGFVLRADRLAVTGGSAVLFRSILLPFLDSRGDLGYVLGSAGWRVELGQQSV